MFANGFVRNTDRYDAIEPTLGAIDISLSLRTTINGVFSAPALFSASYARPPVRAPSPMTATTVSSPPVRSRAWAIPSAAETAVLAWPAPNGSYSDSLRIANPEIPPPVRIVPKRSRRPVNILWTYVWWLTSQTSLSYGRSSTRCSASVSSTTPRFGARCPPLTAHVSTSIWRISQARVSMSARSRRLTSAGEAIFSTIIVIGRRFVARCRISGLSRGRRCYTCAPATTAAARRA